MTEHAEAYRKSAYDAVSTWMEGHSSNTIANSQIWHAVNVALDRFEDELTQTSEAQTGYAVMLDGYPMLIVTTRRQAKQQMKLMKRNFNGGHWKIWRTQVAREIR